MIVYAWKMFDLPYRTMLVIYEHLQASLAKPPTQSAHLYLVVEDERLDTQALPWRPSSLLIRFSIAGL